MDSYDVIVIGGGATGENVAWYAIDNGLSAAIVEEALLGGECTYWACMPSKALLRPGEVLAAARRVPAVEPAITGSIDTDRALRARDAFASRWDHRHQVAWAESIGAAVVRGRGRLAGPRRVSVAHPDGSTSELVAQRAVVIATGSVAALPPIDGLTASRVWDPRAATSADHIPTRLAVLGGGPVGVELAQAFRRLGSVEVTVLEALDRLLPREEPFASALLADALAEEGIAVRTGVRVVRVERTTDDGPVVITLQDGERLQADELLVATGRRPATADLGLETVGLEPGSWLRTDAQPRVEGVEGGWLYACGDVTGRSLLTHMGKYHARIAADAIAGRPVAARAEPAAVPRVVFTDPQVAAVGPTQLEAGEGTHAVAVDLGAVAGFNLLGRGYRGRAQLLLREDRVVGATFVGPGAGELLHAATVVVVGEVAVTDLWHAVPAYPTVSEVWLRLLERIRGVP